MIQIKDPLEDQGFRVLYYIMAVGSFVGIFGMIPLRDGADVLVSVLCGLICAGTIYQLYAFYRDRRKNSEQMRMNFDDAAIKDGWKQYKKGDRK